MDSHRLAEVAVHRLAALVAVRLVDALDAAVVDVLVAVVSAAVAAVEVDGVKCPIASTGREVLVPESGNPGLMVHFPKTGVTLSVLARAVAVAEKVELHRELVRALGPFVEHELWGPDIQNLIKTSLESDEFTTGNTRAGADEQLRTQQGTAD